MAQFHGLEGLRYRYMQKILQKAETTPHCTNVSHCITLTITHPNKSTDSGAGGWSCSPQHPPGSWVTFPIACPLSLPQILHIHRSGAAPSPGFLSKGVTLGLHCCVQQQNLACIACPCLCQVCFKTVCVMHLANICFFSQYSFSP